jgi:hypothetical protein
VINRLFNSPSSYRFNYPNTSTGVSELITNPVNNPHIRQIILRTIVLSANTLIFSSFSKAIASYFQRSFRSVH